MSETPQMLNYAHASNIYAADTFANTQAQQLSQHNQQLGQRAVRAKATEERAVAATRRLVQVFIADANPNVPIDECLLYRGEQKITDATDQELFFELDIKTMLDQHNALRTTWIDKKVKERTEHLEPARIRDLTMTVVEIAKF